MKRGNKVNAIIQARYSSSRLPGKVLKKLGKHEMLKEVVIRAQAARNITNTIVATSTDPSDDRIEEFCIEEGIPCYRGALDDVLGRYYGAAVSHATDHIVRITADCPLLDPYIIESVVERHLEEEADYTSNIEPRYYPDGLDVEVVRFDVLRKLHKTVSDPSLREHVTAGLRRNVSDYKVSIFEGEQDYADHRWTVDTQEDFEWVEAVVASIGDKSRSMGAVIDWIESTGNIRLQTDDTTVRAESRLTGKGQDLYLKAKSLIPGGTQLLSKRPEMFLPNRWPAYYQAARGAWVKDLDGRGYLDMSTSAIGSCLLGTADPVVNAKVAEAVSRGTMSTLNAPEEVELAEKLCSLHPWADKVRFARSGAESMSIAVRIARTSTQKDVVLICGYHGWSDWYLATNLESSSGLDSLLLPGLSPLGVPSGLKGSAYPFHFNDQVEFEELVQKNDGRIAAVVMEPQRYLEPDKKFLQSIRQKTQQQSAVLIFDEITSGWRKNIGGVHMTFGVTPDIAVFGKALSNGYAMGAVIGSESVMQAAQDSFISSTYWTERIGPVAALATIARFEELNAPELVNKSGLAVQKIWEGSTADAGILANVGNKAMTPLSHFSFSYGDAKLNHSLKTLWCQEMLKRGVLDNGSFYATCSHGDKELELYQKNVMEVCSSLVKSLEAGTVEEEAGELSHQAFRRLTS